MWSECNPTKLNHCALEVHSDSNETDLIKQLQRLVGEINLNEVSIKKQIESEVLRYKKFQRSLLGQTADVQVSDIDIRNYAKFILKDGEVSEKRKLLTSFGNTILLKYKVVDIEKP